jgi:hypothetical protein
VALDRRGAKDAVGLVAEWAEARSGAAVVVATYPPRFDWTNTLVWWPGLPGFDPEDAVTAEIRSLAEGSQRIVDVRLRQRRDLLADEMRSMVAVERFDLILLAYRCRGSRRLARCLADGLAPYGDVVVLTGDAGHLRF